MSLSRAELPVILPDKFQYLLGAIGMQPDIFPVRGIAELLHQNPVVVKPSGKDAAAKISFFMQQMNDPGRSRAMRDSPRPE